MRGTETSPSSVPLRLDLLRHGEALPADASGDSARRLSPRGRATISRLAERFAREGWRPTAVWASPLLRAQETAAILVAGACDGLAIATHEALTPEREPGEVIAELTALEPRGHLVLIGHQPLMGRLVHWLSGHDGAFPPGGLVRLELDGVAWRGAAAVTLEIRP